MVAAPIGAPVWITGSVSTTGAAISSVTVTNPVNTFNNGTQAVSGSVSIVGAVNTYNNGTQAVSGNVAISYQANVTGSTYVVGPVNVFNNGTQAVSGSVSVTGPVNTFNQGTQSVSGSVSIIGAVNTFNAGTQAVSGNVAVSYQANVTGSTYVVGPVNTYNNGTQAVSGSVSITGFVSTFNPGTQAVSGNVAISYQANVTGSTYITTTGSLPASIFGTVGPVAVKPASTTAVAADFALAVSQRAAFSGTVQQVTASVSSQILLAANPARINVMFYNDSPKVLFLKFGNTASTTSYSTQLGPGQQWPVPFSYTGRIDGIWQVATGSAYVTELV
jgi:hypothetical protein